jgi:hypothetical protein
MRQPPPAPAHLDRLAAAVELTAEQRAELLRIATHQCRRAAPVGALLEPGPATTPLIGRRAEPSDLFAHLDGDGPAAVGYDGVAGIGKSPGAGRGPRVGYRERNAGTRRRR